MAFVRRLIWDAWNVAHIARHQVTPEEVEQTCHGAPETLTGKKGRLLLIGPTTAGRMIAAVLEPLGRGVFYPVTARPASRKERRYYQEQQAQKGGQPI
jgi:uncharacterized protein